MWNGHTYQHGDHRMCQYDPNGWWWFTSSAGPEYCLREHEAPSHQKPKTDSLPMAPAVMPSPMVLLSGKGIEVIPSGTNARGTTDETSSANVLDN